MSIGVGVIGLGFGELVHLPGWASLQDDGVRIASVCAREEAQAKAAADRFGAAGWTTDWRELVADPAVSLVSIATPPATHVELSLAALRAGKAVLCEKPLGLDPAAALGVADEGGTVAIDFPFRALPELRAARAHHEVVQQFRITWHVQQRDDTGWSWSWKDSAKEGGGALALYGVHVLDYVEWMLGPIDRVRASVRHHPRNRADAAGTARPVTADEGFTAHLVLEEGTEGSVEVSLTAESPLHRIELIGAGGPVELEPTIEPGAGPVDDRVVPFSTLAAELVEALREGRPASPSARDGARALALLEAARESARTGLEVRPRSGAYVQESR